MRVRRRPLKWSRVAGFVGPAGVRLRGLRLPSTSASPPPVTRGASGSGGTMFTSTGSSGLYKAPVSKGLLLVPSALSLLLALLLPHCQRFFVYDLQAVKDDFQIWRLICGRIICLDLKDTFCSSLLIYNFRIFERRYGSRKFASFLLGSWVLSVVGDFILVEAVRYSFGITAARNLPSGFLAPVFALFVPFYCSIPRVQVAHILGPLSITNKTLIYILGLQFGFVIYIKRSKEVLQNKNVKLFTSGSYIWIVAISGLISGLCYNSKMLQVHEVLCVPSWMAKFCSWTLEPIFSSSEPTSEARIGMGATVDIQRQQRMELLDRQLMLSQFAQVRRQRQQQGGMINWNRLFPPLRQRRNVNYQDGRQSEQQASPPLEVSEEQVARLMEMGFSRGDALEALRASNNDLNVATNFLLQH
ncbi:ubiquitin-associated domain-containing protein 2 isoform X1 [Sagmatias obliquidens]|uniref:ubiquitin-associated domain-containing protein 2 isoform X1 n=1 Tax=Sagmatias obliquidens TaxID=3371155 RepID=UPI000F443DF8|nr:ubiquitin-associated domain-containing protein 2 isoform X1 [Lagenorhynchus obliquidens]